VGVGSSLVAIWAAAAAEVRSARRQVRTWLFGLIAVGFSFIWFAASGADHASNGWRASTAGLPAPRYLMSDAGMFLVLIFALGVIFLAFDIRARDRRERMVEILDSRPISNLELVLGRVLGVVLTALVPALVLAILLQAYGSIGGALGLPTEPIQAISLARFLVVDALPVFVAWAVVVVLLAVLLRNRLLTAIAALGLFVTWFLWSQSLPLYLLHLPGPTLGSNLVSDILPRFAEPTVIVHRLALFALAAGLLVAAAAFYPRLDDGSRVRRLAAVPVLLLLGGGAMAGLYMHAQEGAEAREQWLAAHRAAAQASVRPDLEHVGGTVRIDPDGVLEIDVAMRLELPADQDRLVMSFNPGMVVEEVLVGGERGTAVHRDGLLVVDTTPGKRQVEVALRAAGVPDPAFAYLDSAHDFETGGSGAENASFYLGRYASIYETEYVALMPGVHWLPHPGPNVGADDPGEVARDFHDVDLLVEVPGGWLVAGPGRRRPEGEGRFRFNPRSPVSAVALIASRFERRATEIAGVELEVLVAPQHAHNLTLFEEAEASVREHLEELFGEAARIGLDYPYGALSYVEIPVSLRTCGGGWRMDTVMGQPGVMLMSERGFPTARFDPVSGADVRGRSAEVDGGAFKFHVLRRFFSNDFRGGNPYVGVARNFMRHQTGLQADGMGSTTLEFVVEQLAVRFIAQSEGFFSAHVYTPDGRSSLRRLRGAFANAFDFGAGPNSALDAVAHRPVIWDLALSTSLADLDPTHDPRQVLDVLALKGDAVARSIFDALGRQGTGALLSELRRRHRGDHYDLAAFYETARDVGTDLEPLLGDWIHDRALPGFLASPVEIVRLADTHRGSPRFQSRVHIRNDEPVPGLLRLGYVTADLSKRRRAGPRFGEPIRIPADSSVEVALVTGSPIKEVWLSPYLSLNRRDVRLTTDVTDAPGVEGFNGTRPSDWLPPPVEGIVVDDLDPGFRVVRDVRRSGLRIAGRASPPAAPTGELDNGIPEYAPLAVRRVGSGRDGEWRRQELPSSWGKYRRTVARAWAADGHARAVFETQLPRAGEWRLAYHLPFVNQGAKKGFGTRLKPMVVKEKQGDYEMVLEFGGRRETVDFDGAAAVEGWNDLGRYDLPRGPVRLVVSNRTTGDVVVADAVRWLSATPEAADARWHRGEE